MQGNENSDKAQLDGLQLDGLLPAATETDNSKPTDESPQPPVEKSILIVDDSRFFLTSINSTLQNTGFKVTCISSGSAALNFLKNHSPDLFILDIDMPEMNGFELAQKVKQAGHSAPIIFLTGNSSTESVIMAKQSGAVDFLIKPASKAALLERIGKYLN